MRGVIAGAYAFSSKGGALPACLQAARLPAGFSERKGALSGRDRLVVQARELEPALGPAVEGRDEQIVDHLLRSAVLSMFRPV